jgi:hypothetical protein
LNVCPRLHPAALTIHSSNGLLAQIREIGAPSARKHQPAPPSEAAGCANNKAKGQIGDASRFSFFISGCSLRRSATRNGGGPPFRTVDTTIRPRIPIFRTGVEPRRSSGATAAGRHLRFQLMGPGSPACSHRPKTPSSSPSPSHAAGSVEYAGRQESGDKYFLLGRWGHPEIEWRDQMIKGALLELPSGGLLTHTL